ncbi:MAG: hypothetical protein P8X43_08210 [Maritimibacter sp.]
MTTYLLHGLLVSILGLAALAIPTRQRGVALASGIAAAPMGLMDVWFVRDYWQPDHLIGAWFSIEGVLFSFGNGILLWLIASWPLRHALPAARPMRDFARPMLRLGALALAVILALWSHGLGLTPLTLMPSTFAGLAVLLLLILARYPTLAGLAALGCLSFTALYAGELVVMSTYDPAYSELWYPHLRMGLAPLGFPLEELIWAALYGAVWSLCVASSLHPTRRGFELKRTVSKSVAP